MRSCQLACLSLEVLLDTACLTVHTALCLHITVSVSPLPRHRLLSRKPSVMIAKLQSSALDNRLVLGGLTTVPVVAVY